MPEKMVLKHTLRNCDRSMHLNRACQHDNIGLEVTLMTQATQRLLEQAMALPADEKIRFAEELLASLDPADQKEIDAAWAEEIDRRIADYDAGRAQAIPADEVFRRLRERAR
jgi:putative addiction module component (TIGR02574 family)